jgi:hypothetical protein
MSSWLSRAKPACTGYDGLFLQRPLFRSSREARHSQRSVDRNYGDRAFIAVLGYICSYPPCRARPSLPVECRPKFISVASWGVRFRECSTPSIRFNLCENCYKSGMHRLPSGESPSARRSPPARDRIVRPTPGAGETPPQVRAPPARHTGRDAPALQGLPRAQGGLMEIEK